LFYLAYTSCIPLVFRCHGAKDQYEDQLLKQSHHQVAKPNAKSGKENESEKSVKSQLLLDMSQFNEKKKANIRISSQNSHQVAKPNATI
jgi:hypothetical protein